MDTLKLPLVDPPIKGLLRWPYTLSITHQHEQTLPWFYCNFIQLWSTQNFLTENKELFFDFYRGNRNELYYNNPFLIANAMSFQIASFLTRENIVDYLTERMHQGYYPVIYIDESRISYSAIYQGGPFPHHIMIYGFNRADRMFDVCMYNRRWMYGQTRIPFNELIEGFFSLKKVVEETGMLDEQMFFYKFNENYTFTFDKTVVMQQIEDYINCETGLNRINFNPAPEAFGLEIYRCLSEYYGALKEGYPSLNMRGVIRHLNTLGEHKRGMVERIRYYVQIGAMKQDDALLNEFHDLAIKAEIMRVLLLKYFQRRDKQNLEKILNYLQYSRPTDQTLMERLLTRLKT